MLVKNNVSASKLITKMQFDNNPTRHRILFSPVAAVADEYKEVLKQQTNSPAAQSAIKLSVYQHPEATREAVKFEVFDDIKKGVTIKNEAQEQEVLDIVNKWKK
jgi:hypothetical protein